MTAPVDALDRFASALRSQLGRDASRPVTVQEIVQQLLPYRRWRDALELESAEDYEHVLLRLLSGERGYVEGPPAMQQRLADELASAAPDLTVYRAYAHDVVTSVHAPDLPLPAPRTSVAVPLAPEVAVPLPHHRTVHAEELGGRCRYCAQSLPSGRALVFCPHCGQNLTTLRCPACSTELELGWKFCVTCGRGLGTPAG